MNQQSIIELKVFQFFYSKYKLLIFHFAVIADNNNSLSSTIKSNFVTNILSFILSRLKRYSILYNTLSSITFWDKLFFVH